MVHGRIALGLIKGAIGAGAALRRVVPPAAVARAVQRGAGFLRRQIGGKAPPRVAVKPAIRGLPKRVVVPKAKPGIPRRIAGKVVGGAIAGGAFFAGEQFARRKLFKPELPIPSGDGRRARPTEPVASLPAVTGPVAGGFVAGGLLPAAGRIAVSKGRIGKGMGIVSGLTGLARRGAVPALAGAGVVAIGGQVVDSVTGQVVGVRRVKRSRIGFKRSDLKAFRRVISTAKRVKKILTQAGIGTFRKSSSRAHFATPVKGRLVKDL